MNANKFALLIPVLMAVLVSGGCNSSGGGAKKDAAAASTAPVVTSPPCSPTTTTTTSPVTTGTPAPSGGVFLTDCIPTVGPSIIPTVTGGTPPPGGFDALLTPPASCQTNVWLPVVKTAGVSGTCHTLVTKLAGCDEAKAKQLFIARGVPEATVNSVFAEKLSGGFTVYQCGSAANANPFVNFILKSTNELKERCLCIKDAPECSETYCPKS